MPEDLKSQLDFVKAINTQISSINTRLADQLRMQELINLSVKGQLDKAKDAGNLTEAAMKQAGVGATSASAAVNLTTGALDKNAVAATSAGAAGTSAFSAMTNAADKTMAAMDANARLIDGMISKPLFNELKQVQKAYGGLTGSGGIFQSTNKLAGQIVDTTMDLYGSMTDMGGKWTEIFGRDPRMTIGETTEVLEKFNDLVTGDMGLVYGLRVAKDMTADDVIAMQGYAKAAGISMEDAKNMVARQISQTGKAGVDVLAEVAVFSKRLEGATGDSAKMISKHMVKIIDDTDRFANVTRSQAGMISVQLRQLGLSYQDLGGAVDKFMNFETAADSVSKLTTVFGVQMDAMDMMMAAQEGEETLMLKMRESFLASGKSIDDMTKAEKRLIKEQLGLSKVESVENLLDPSRVITSMEDLADITGEGTGTMEENFELLKEDIHDLQSATDYVAPKMAARMKESFFAPTQKTMITFNENMGEMGNTIQKAIPKDAAASMKYFGKSIADIAGFDESKLTMLKDNLGQIAGFLSTMGKDLKGTDLGKELHGLLGKSEIGKAAMGIPAGFKPAMDSMVKDFESAIDELVEVIKKSKLYSNSPSEVGLSVAKGMSEPWEMAFDNMTAKTIRFQGHTEATVQSIRNEVAGNVKYQEQIQSDYYNKLQKLQKKREKDVKKAQKAVDKAKKKSLQDGATQAEAAALKEAIRQKNTADNKAKLAAVAISDFNRLKNGEVTTQVQVVEEGAKQEIELKDMVKDKALQAIKDEEKAELAKKDKLLAWQKEQADAKTDLSKADIQKRKTMLAGELKDRKSFYGAAAKALGKEGQTYSQLTAQQKMEYAKRLNLGANYEQELKQIMSSKTFKEGMGAKKKETSAKNILEKLKGKDMDDISPEVIKKLQKEYGIDEKGLSSFLKGKTSAEDLASAGTGAQLKEIETKEKEKTEAKEDKGGSSSRATAQASREQVAQLQHNAEVMTMNGEAILEVQSAIDKLHTMLEGKNYKPAVVVSVDGKAIARAVAENNNTVAGTIKVD